MLFETFLFGDVLFDFSNVKYMPWLLTVWKHTYSMSYGVLGPLLLPLYNSGESLVWNSTVHQAHSQWVLDSAWAVTFHWIWSSFLYTQFIGAWDTVWDAFRILSLSFIGNIVLLASSGSDLLLSLWKVIPEVEETGMKVGTSKSEAAVLIGEKRWNAYYRFGMSCYPELRGVWRFLDLVQMREEGARDWQMDCCIVCSKMMVCQSVVIRAECSSESVNYFECNTVCLRFFLFLLSCILLTYFIQYWCPVFENFFKVANNIYSL